MHPTFRLAAVFITLLTPLQPAQAAAACKVTPSMLEGAWQRAGRSGFFEQMEFAREDGRRVFNSWLHERPEMSNATWSFDQCTLRIHSVNEPALAFAYEVRMPSRDRLELKEAKEPVARYRRIKP